MTSRRRTYVVELLRCAADLGLRDVNAPLTEAARRLGYDDERSIRVHPIVADADCALLTLDEERPNVDPSWESFGLECLEVAMRVEEGSLP